MQPGPTAPLLERLKIMADLTEEQKGEIVEALACYRDVPSIMRAFHMEYGIQLDRKQVGRYDPTRPYFAGSEKWREVFEARRRAYLEDVAAVPVAHQGYRLNILQRGVEAAEKAGNWLLAARLLEQAAKEVGGVLTNQRDLRIDDQRRPRAAEMTPEDRKAAITEVIRQAMELRREQQEGRERLVATSSEAAQRPIAAPSTLQGCSN